MTNTKRTLRIVIPGGSGQVGTVLARTFHRDGHEVTVLSRTPTSAPWRTVYWDARTLDEWVETIQGADVVINLAGRSVNCRYTAKNRRLIMESRIDSTRVLGEAIAKVSVAELSAKGFFLDTAHPVEVAERLARTPRASRDEKPSGSAAGKRLGCGLDDGARLDFAARPR